MVKSSWVVGWAQHKTKGGKLSFYCFLDHDSGCQNCWIAAYKQEGLAPY